MSYKAIFALYTIRNLDIDHIDVKTDFFYTLAKEIIYFTQLISYFDESTWFANFEKYYMA